MNAGLPLERFLRDIERRAFRIAELATGNSDDALDIVQESMLRFAHRYSRHVDSEWPPLFHRVLQNQIRDWYRRDAVRRKWRVWFSWGRDDDEGDRDPLEQIADAPSAEPAAKLQLENAAEAMLSAIRCLPMRQQQAFLLRAWEGLDTEQTAVAMGCSVGSVKTHYSRAIHTLREQLEDYWS